MPDIVDLIKSQHRQMDELLEQADEMIEACKKAGVLLMYAEELLFAPKYVRAKTLIDEGAIGEPFLAKQSEEHPGPHMGWFWDVNRSGGGVICTRSAPPACPVGAARSSATGRGLPETCRELRRAPLYRARGDSRYC